jgi:hypothetical protein
LLGDLAPGGGAAQHALDLVPPLVIQIPGEQFPQPRAALTRGKDPGDDPAVFAGDPGDHLGEGEQVPPQGSGVGGHAEFAAGAVRERGADQLCPAVGRRAWVAVSLDKYLDHVHATKSARTWRAYGLTFQKFCDKFGEQDVAGLDPDAVAEWFTGRWGQGSAQGWNANRSALTSAAAWWRDQPDIPVTGDPFSRIGRRAVPPDRSRAMDRGAVEKLITSQRVPLRERCFWSLLYDSAARSAEVLRLDVGDLDLANHRARGHS